MIQNKHKKEFDEEKFDEVEFFKFNSDNNKDAQDAEVLKLFTEVWLLDFS